MILTILFFYFILFCFLFLITIRLASRIVGGGKRPGVDSGGGRVKALLDCMYILIVPNGTRHISTGKHTGRVINQVNEPDEVFAGRQLDEWPGASEIGRVHFHEDDVCTVALRERETPVEDELGLDNFGVTHVSS